MNEAGQTVGYASINLSLAHGVLWHNGIITDTTLQNDFSPLRHAVLWENSAAIDLGVLPGDEESELVDHPVEPASAFSSGLLPA